jgi:hypothetical protein
VEQQGSGEAMLDIAKLSHIAIKSKDQEEILTKLQEYQSAYILSAEFTWAATEASGWISEMQTIDTSQQVD